jgi:hypothetical protein
MTGDATLTAGSGQIWFARCGRFHYASAVPVGAFVQPQMNADNFPCKEETHAIIGTAFEVLNELGHGLNEKLYENSLVEEFKRRQIAFDQQRRFEVLSKGEYVGEFIPDLIAFGKVVVDTKCIDRITD